MVLGPERQLNRVKLFAMQAWQAYFKPQSAGKGCCYELKDKNSHPCYRPSIQVTFQYFHTGNLHDCGEEGKEELSGIFRKKLLSHLQPEGLNHMPPLQKPYYRQKRAYSPRIYIEILLSSNSARLIIKRCSKMLKLKL